MTSDVMNLNVTNLGDQVEDEDMITHKDLVKSALGVGSLGMEFSWTYYKQMNIAFCLMLANMLKKIYRNDPEGYKAALERHLAFFNITVQFAPFVGGVAISMEERVARGEIEPESVNDVKAALMGPLSGIGDSIFLATIRVIAAAVGIALCQAGNPFGPIAFLLIFNIPGFWLRIWGVQKGYELGVDFLAKAQENGLMTKVMTAVSIVGIMVVGAMSVDMFWASIPIEIGVGENVQTVQDILDGIMPGMLGMAAFWIYYWLLSKKISPSWLIVGSMLLGVVGVYFGFLA
ncbi:PTS mannose transporter subunit IID [Leptogranulimonas caecicola]|uniref:PTS mannose transporter subunit IID n=2 Tax=Leptogranulimonas caecicola TaxID=2894156 RepID=A0AAU9CA08_9ACTN|nr:PTS mannose transporter subunit IID [Leptogranulimonas caecicola]